MRLIAAFLVSALGCSGGSSGSPTSCGHLGQPCCPSSPCVDTQTACSYVDIPANGHCTHCGNAGEPCCFDSSIHDFVCSAGMACAMLGMPNDVSATCMTCGGFGEVCCAAPSRCGQNLSCAASSWGGFTNGTCSCGDLGQACCAGSGCRQGFICVSGSCVSTPDGGSLDAG